MQQDYALIANDVVTTVARHPLTEESLSVLNGESIVAFDHRANVTAGMTWDGVTLKSPIITVVAGVSTTTGWTTVQTSF